MSFPLFDLFSNHSAEEAAAKANAGLQQGLSELRTSYGQGRDALSSNYGRAADLWGGLAGTYAPGVAAYGDVSGANGVEGLQRGTDLFKNSGQYGVYGFARDQALQAAERTHAAAGNLSSGNADYDAMKTASGLAGQNWGTFQQGLLPYMQNYGTAVAGQAGSYADLGKGLDASYRGEGGAANDTYTGVGKNLAGAELNNYKVGANILNAGTDIAKMVASLPPGTFNFGGSSGSGGGPSDGGYYGSAGAIYPGPTQPKQSLFSAFS